MRCSVEECTNEAGTGKRANRERMCVMHHTRWKRHGDPHADRTRKASVRYEVDADGCWIWSGKKDQGYGVVKVDGRRKRAHRWTWETAFGPIPDGLTLDHLCHNQAVAEGRCEPGVCKHRSCVNLTHLALTTSGENARRGALARTHCKHGHDFTPENTRLDTRGRRICLTCRRDIEARRR